MRKTVGAQRGVTGSVRPMKWRIIAIPTVVVVAALAVNALLVSRTTRPAEAFDGGRVLELDGPDLNVKESGPSGDRAVVLLHGVFGVGGVVGPRRRRLYSASG